MIFNNILTPTQTREQINENEKENKMAGNVNFKLGPMILNILSGEAGISGENRGNRKATEKMIETFEVKTTKAIILNEVIEKCKKITKVTDCHEGELIQLNDVKLSLNNEEELRTIKMLSNGLLKGSTLPETGGWDLSNMLDSLFKDYTYKIIGNTGNDEKVIIKIPMTFENEFESQYSIDDVFIGSVSIIGIYKGVIEYDLLKNSFDYFNQKPQNKSITIKYDEIRDSQSKEDIEEDRSDNNGEEKEKYHYIDLLAILQILKVNEKYTYSDEKN